MTDRLYLLCYWVETEYVPKTNKVVSTQKSSKESYFDGHGNYVADMRKIVLLQESPRIVVDLGTSTKKECEDALNHALRTAHIEKEERERWSVDHECIRHAIPLFYIIDKNDIPDVRRTKILSCVYSTADFAENYFEKNLDSFSYLDLQYKEKVGETNFGARRPVILKTAPIKNTNNCNAKEYVDLVDAQDDYFDLLKQLAASKDNDNPSRRLFRYEKTIPLLIIHFLERLEELQLRQQGQSNPDNARTSKMLALETEADRYWPPNVHTDHWIKRTEMPGNLNSLRTEANSRAFYKAPNKLSGWDRKKRYWRKFALRGVVFYYRKTKNGLQDGKGIESSDG